MKLPVLLLALAVVVGGLWLTTDRGQTQAHAQFCQAVTWADACHASPSSPPSPAARSTR